MILCPSCETLNPEGEARCLACQATLDSSGGSSPTVAEGSANTTARCPNGHPVDPAWGSCPYCARQSGSGKAASTATRVEDTAAATGGNGRKTRLETTHLESKGSGAGRRTRLAGEEPAGEAEAKSPPPAPPAPASEPTSKPPRRLRTTRLEEPASPRSAGRSTVLRPAPAGPTPEAEAPASSRRLVAALAAPDLRPGGAVFAVREGKNRIGADRDSEIRLHEDPQVSGQHALLLYRGGAFHLADRMSTNGTAVNGEELTGTHSTVLQDRDRIRCGATELVFLTFEDPAPTAEDEQSTATDEPADDA